MGLRYRKSINLGPLRLNLSKSGVGYSYGVKGYRVTHTANGKVRTTRSIPGTGVSHVTEVSEAQYRRQQERQRQERKAAAQNGMPLFAKVLMGALLLLCLAFVFAGCSAEEPAPTEPMSVQEAILQMNLLGHEFFVFRNMDAEDAISVVYERKNGGYGLICDDGLND